MRVSAPFLVLAALAVPAVPAAQEAGSAEVEARSTEATKDEQEGSDDDKKHAHPDLRGNWAQRVVTTAVSEVPIVGKVVTRTISVQRVEITQKGRDLEMTTEVCDIRVNSSVDVVETHIPDRFVAAMGTVKRPAKLVERDGVFELVVPKKLELIGVELREPTSEYLPTDPDDPRVIDQDKDGHPGVTVKVSGLIDGSLYIVHRGWDRLVGTFDGSDRIAGPVKWDLEQKVLDSTSVFLGDPPKSKAHPNPNKSHFGMRRVADKSDCKSIMSQRATLFADK